MLKRTLLAAAITAAPLVAQAQSVEDLQKQIDILAREIESLKTQESPAYKSVQLGGYGEHHYNNYRGTNGDDDQIDAHRFVLFFGYDFSDRIRFFSEFELEHSLAGEGKPGEVELEQAFIQFDTSKSTRLTAGLFLVPVGILNETHEPDTFYGVERNALESTIVPATWWETGVMFSQDLGQGLSYDVALHSGLQAEDDYNIRSGRQKSAEAIANDGALTARVKYNGIPGLNVGVTVQQQNDLHQSAPDGDPLTCTGPAPAGCSLGFADEVPDVEARLTEAHVRYTVAGLQLTAQRAEWDIDSDAAKAIGKDNQKATMFEVGYKLIEQVGIFARQTNVDTSAGSADANDTETVIVTGGVNYWPHQRVVVKADYQDFDYKSDAGDDGESRFNLGLGWSF